MRKKQTSRKGVTSKGRAIRPTAIDLFCGCGGLTQGLRDAGFHVLAAVDLDPLSIKTYQANHTRVLTWESDIREVDPLEVAKEVGLRAGQLDLLAGCPPCQGFSTMRTLNGKVTVDDPRNDLLAEFERFVEDLLPRAIMMENVPGLASDGRFSSFVERVKALGYKGESKILNAVDYRVPQRRRRLIFIAGRGMEIPYAIAQDSQRTVREVLATLPAAGTSGDPVHDIPEKRSPRILELIRSIPKDGGSRTDLPDDRQLECHKRCDGFKDVYGRMAWDAPAPTITSGCFNPSKGRFLHPEEDRAITMREAAVLQGFPVDYKFPTTENKSAIALMVGNALPPPFITAHARSIKRALRKQEKGLPNGRGINRT